MSEAAETLTSRVESRRSVGAGKLLPWLNLFGIMTLSFAGVGLIQAVWLPISVLPGQYPGINLTLVMGIGLAAAALLVLTLMRMGTLVGRPAPDYVLASRVVNPLLGFAFSWTFLIGGGLFVGSLTSLIPRLFLPDMANMLGSVLQMYDLQVFSAAVQNPQLIVYVGSGLVLIAFALSILSPRTIQTLFWVGGGLSIVGWAGLLWSFSSVAGGQFSQYFDRIYGAGAYGLHLDLAFQLGMNSQSVPVLTLLMIGALVGISAFFGIALPAFMAGEKNTQHGGMVTGGFLVLLIGGFLILSMVMLVERTISWQFLAAESFLRLKGVSGEGGVVLPVMAASPGDAGSGVLRGIVLPWLPFYGAVLRTNPFFLFFSAAVWLVMLVMLLQVYILSLSRIIKAWAQDGAVPEWMGFVHTRQQSPLIALLFVSAIALVVVVDGAQAAWLQATFNFPLFVAFSQLLPVIALVIIKPSYFSKIGDNSSESYSTWFRLLAVLTLILLLGVIILSFVLEINLLPTGWGTVGLLAGTFIAGLLWFMLRRAYLKRRGIDLMQAYKTLPED
ncbi:MAG: hypothetical protein AB1453_09230 [Chloroflexota bacterium]